jgi:hypothetical protein
MYSIAGFETAETLVAQAEVAQAEQQICGQPLDKRHNYSGFGRQPTARVTVLQLSLASSSVRPTVLSKQAPRHVMFKELCFAGGGGTSESVTAVSMGPNKGARSW